MFAGRSNRGGSLVAPAHIEPKVIDVQTVADALGSTHLEEIKDSLMDEMWRDDTVRNNVRPRLCHLGTLLLSLARSGDAS